MTTVYRYNPQTKRMDTVVVEGGNGGNGEYRTWMGIPSDVVSTLLRYAREDKIDLGVGADTDRASATAKGKALKLYLMAGIREFISQRDAKAKVDADIAEAAAKANAKAPEAAPVLTVPQPASNGKPKQVQGTPKVTTLVR